MTSDCRRPPASSRVSEFPAALGLLKMLALISRMDGVIAPDILRILLYSRSTHGSRRLPSPHLNSGDPVRLLPTSLALVGISVVVGAAGLAGCSSDTTNNSGGGGSSPSSQAAGSGTVPTAGKPGTSTAGSGGTGVVGAGGSGNNTSTGGSNTVTGGSSSTGGSGQVSTGGSGNPSGGTGSSTGGTSSTGGGATNPNAPDMMGKTNAKPGDKTSTKLDYLKMGEMRLINNNWGSVAWNCTDKSPSSVYINSDKSFGWSFDRPDCDTNNSNTKPDFPEIEFGIHPFGLGSSEATSPNFSTTTLLPKQVKDITSATVVIDGLEIKLSSEGSWDLTFELWLSSKNPATTQGNAGVFAELMTFWGWQPNRWPITGGMDSGPQCEGGCKNGLSAGDKSYDLIVRKNSWGSGWQYFQFRTAGGASSKTFNGKVDVKALLDYLMTLPNYSKDMYLTRLEVGSEIDDMTKGSVSMKNITFEINGEKRSPVFGQ